MATVSHIIIMGSHDKPDRPFEHMSFAECAHLTGDYSLIRPKYAGWFTSCVDNKMCTNPNMEPTHSACDICSILVRTQYI